MEAAPSADDPADTKPGHTGGGSVRFGSVFGSFRFGSVWFLVRFGSVRFGFRFVLVWFSVHYWFIGLLCFRFGAIWVGSVFDLVLALGVLCIFSWGGLPALAPTVTAVSDSACQHVPPVRLALTYTSHTNMALHTPESPQKLSSGRTERANTKQKKTTDPLPL